MRTERKKVVLFRKKAIRQFRNQVSIKRTKHREKRLYSVRLIRGSLLFTACKDRLLLRPHLFGIISASHFFGTENSFSPNCLSIYFLIVLKIIDLTYMY